MGKRVMDHNDGKPVEYSVTRTMRKSEERLIPWTAGPQSKWQKFKRAAVG
jgi:hypothetical protein